MANHLRALLVKNWILWKRNWVCSCCELLIPTLLIFALIGIRTAVEKEDIPEISYINLPKEAGGPQVFPSDMDDYANVYIDVMDAKSRKTLLPVMAECMRRIRQGKFWRGGEVALIPESDPIIQKIGSFMDHYGYKKRFFKSDQEITEFIGHEYYGKEEEHPYLCFGVNMLENQRGNYRYQLYYNTSGGPGMDDVPRTQEIRTDPIRTQRISKQNLWINSGWLTIQNWIDNLIIEQDVGSNVEITASASSIRVPAHVSDDFASLLKGQFGIYLVLPLMIIYLRMTYALLYEKEKKLREGMKMMGLQNSSFYLSWIITYFIIYTIISIIATILIRSNVFPNTNPGLIFLNYWLFCLVLIFQSMFISVFFTRALFGIIVAIVWYLLKFLVLSIVGSGGTPTTSAYWGASLSSHAGLSFAYDVMASFESEGKGVQMADLNTSVENYYVSIALSMHILNIILYAVLAIYLDQVFPNEWGKKKHLLFFLQCKRKISNKVDKNQSYEQDPLMDERVEQVEQLYKEMEDRNEAVLIKNLFKTYPSGKQAVKNLTLSMYEGQIFALLGHNGAGKTTTISMLTGLLDITTGKAIAYGKDIEEEIEDIRKFMGVCPQHDILFDNLTVKEHLEMFASFKGMPNYLIQAETQKMIEDVDLTEKTNYLAKNLSGGQKRKLSVAIAFIGGSKLIYLDEPTSGMDTSARRYIWEMLKNYKSQRIVVLTTHFMDEADFLGDRIAIMGEGQLICCGSSVFLKNKFGVGYNLTLVKEDTNIDSQPIISLVQNFVPQASVLSNVSSEIVVQLPMTAVEKFPELFDKLDSSLKDLHINSYGISITTLEEVFLKVAQIGAGHHQVNEHMQDEKQDERMGNIDDFDMNKIRITSSGQLFLTHTFALLQKRIRYFKRDIRSLMCEVLLPCLIVVVGLGLMTIEFIVDPLPLELTVENLPWSPSRAAWAGDDNAQIFFEKFDDSWKLDILKEQGQTLQEQRASVDLQFFKDYNIRKDIGYFFVNSVTPDNKIDYMILGNSVHSETLPMMMNEMNQAILRKLSNNNKATIIVINQPLPLPISVRGIENTADGFLAAFVFSLGMSFIPASIISYIVKEREINIKHQQLVSGVSVLSYWFSNFFMDICKHIVPAIFCSLMILAFDIENLREGDNFGAMWLFFFLYGWAIIPFSYLTSFLFQKQGNALLISFFFNLLVGALISLVVWVLRLIESTREAAKILAWFLRFIPSFSFSYGILNMSNITLYAAIEGRKVPQTVWDFNISGGDLLILGLSGFLYFILIFWVERLEDNGSLQKFASKENSIQYQPKILDDDVVNEAEKCKQLIPKEQAVLVRDIRKVYMLDGSNYKIAVDKLSFSVANGEVFGLLGVNGAGKTTTFKMLSGEIKPTSGEAYIAGHDIVNNMEDARKNIGYCPQFDALLENLTVQEHLELYTIIKGIPNNLKEQLVNKKLKEMDLERFRYIQSGQLSGGNKRKLSVAIAMIGNPPIVFLDEPSTGMDPEARRFMWNVISRIATQRKQSSIILTTHSMEEAEALSTKIAIQVEGNLRCIGSVQHIKNKFGHGYEIEIKVVTPLAIDVKALMNQYNIPLNTRVNTDQAHQILTRMNCEHLINQIEPKGYGSQLHVDLQKQSKLAAEALIEFIMVEGIGQQIMNFISTNLGEFQIIEHFQTFFRFRLNSTITVGKLFGQFELNKNNLKISQYSIKQASIEQIFNQFATQALQLANINLQVQQ